MLSQSKERARRGMAMHPINLVHAHQTNHCLLYTSDAADERSSVELGGRRIIKKKKDQDQEAASALYREQT